jgi:hypothetical protein
MIKNPNPPENEIVNPLKIKKFKLPIRPFLAICFFVGMFYLNFNRPLKLFFGYPTAENVCMYYYEGSPVPAVNFGKGLISPFKEGYLWMWGYSISYYDNDAFQLNRGHAAAWYIGGQFIGLLLCIISFILYFSFIIGFGLELGWPMK